MDSKTVTDNANRLYNLIVRPDIKRKFGIDLDIGWAVSVGQNIMLWYYKFKTPPSKFVVRNQDESGLGARWIFSLLTFRTGKEGRN